MIERKILNKIKINLNETIWFYCGYIARELTCGKKNSEIQIDLSKLITDQMMMIRVAEIIQKLEILSAFDGSKSSLKACEFAIYLS
jgi:urease gamma subunit